MCFGGQIMLLLPYFSGVLWSGDVKCRSRSVRIALEPAVVVCGWSLPGVSGDLEVRLHETVLASLCKMWIAVCCGVCWSGVVVWLLCGYGQTRGWVLACVELRGGKGKQGAGSLLCECCGLL